MNLKEIRSIRNVTQKDVADYLGCAPAVYSRYETGDREPTIQILKKLSKYFGVSVDYLIENESNFSISLSDYEAELVDASLLADERARQDALAMLKMHTNK